MLCLLSGLKNKSVPVFRRLTYRQFIQLASEIFNADGQYKVLKRWQLKLAGLLNQQVRDAAELLQRYQVDNIFVSDKFKKRFLEFRVTTFREGLTASVTGG